MQGPSSGQVTLNADGTFQYIPHFGFVGTDTFVVTVDDGRGGSVNVTVSINVTPVASANAIADTSPTPQQGLATGTQPLVVDGIILDAVSGIAPLDLGSMDLGASGIVINAVNSLSSLDGVGVLRAEPGAQGTIISDPRDLARLAALARTTFPETAGFWESSALTGYSLRMDLGSDIVLDGSSKSSQLVVDTLMRDRVMLVQVSTTNDHSAGKRVLDYQFLLADGRPLPVWVNTADRGVLLVEIPVGGGTLDLKITARLADGSFITRTVAIQNATGEVQEHTVAAYAPMLGQQLIEMRAN